MDNKTCARCKLELPAESFYTKSGRDAQLASYCKDCMRDWKRNWRAKYKDEHGEDAEKRWRTKNADKMRGYQDKYREARVSWVNEFKKVPCKDCGGIFPPVCMDFDHIGNDKDKNIAILVNGNYGRQRILDEIAKCEIVCANCHRLRTNEREKPWATGRKLERR